jgi:prefoldin subunit 5
LRLKNALEEAMPTAKATTKKPAKPAPKTAKKVTLDDVWAIIAEIGKAHKKTEKTLDKAINDLRISHEETEKAIKDTQRNIGDLRISHEETEKAMKEANKAIKDTQRNIGDLSNSHKETEKAIKDTQRNIGGLNNTMGSLVEHIMTPDLPRKFKQFGFTFDRVTTVKWAEGEGNIYAEIDGLLENGKQAMVVEVKTTLRRKDIDDHLERMERVRKYADDHGDKREFLAAMAATIIDIDTKGYALSQGFFVIEPSGEDVKITKPVSDPKVW